MVLLSARMAKCLADTRIIAILAKESGVTLATMKLQIKGKELHLDGFKSTQCPVNLSFDILYCRDGYEAGSGEYVGIELLG